MFWEVWGRFLDVKNLEKTYKITLLIPIPIFAVLIFFHCNQYYFAVDSPLQDYQYQNPPGGPPEPPPPKTLPKIVKKLRKNHSQNYVDFLMVF